MPFDLKKNSTDISTIEFSEGSTDVESPYVFDQTIQENNKELSNCIQQSEEPNSQCITFQDFGQYDGSAYSNQSMYLAESPTLVQNQNCNFQTENSLCSLFNAENHTISPSESVDVMKEHNLIPAIRFMDPSHYNELTHFGLSEIPIHGMESQIDDPDVAYGYVSEQNFDAKGSLNTNTYSPRAIIFDEDFTKSKAIVSSDNPKNCEGHLNFQNKLSQLTLNSIEMNSHSRFLKDDFYERSNDELRSSMKWRDPNLSEVITFLNNPNNKIKANAAAYLQHLCYMDDPNKERTRVLGGIPPLIRLLSYDIPDIHRNACGALRNLSYGRQNDENKRAIKNAGGITALVNLLCRTQDSNVKELITGVLWNLSSCEDIKKSIIEESLVAIVTNIIKPHSGWDPLCPGDTCFSTVFRNASGVLRNVSSAGEFARSSLRSSENLTACLLYVLRSAIEKNNIGNKTVENCVCILRNLSYRCQEVEDPNYDKLQPNRQIASNIKGENLGCFGTSKKKKDAVQRGAQQIDNFSTSINKSATHLNKFSKNYEQLWSPEVVQHYLTLLQTCSNPETLEAAAGAIQNLSACYWQPSVDIRATVRKEKGLPILVELLRMEVDRVVCAVATALRNLAIDQRNKELIGKYAMRDLVQKLPSGNPLHDQNTSDDTISAVLATINEVIKKSPEFSRSLLDAGGVERLMNINKQKEVFNGCVLKFSGQVLFNMWQHNELRDVYKKNGWKESDFLPKFGSAPYSPSYADSTLSRPMASQSRTKYEDKTIQRSQNTNKKNKTDNGQIMYNESSVFCPVIDINNASGTNDETARSSQCNSTMPMYIPMFEGGINHSK